MPKVLIIDDHANVRLVYREAFEAAGFDVIEAPDGRKGVDLFTSDRPDLIITDIEMPELDGHSVISEIRQIQADAKIVAVTGAGLHHLPVAHELGADRIFEKPLRPRDLLAAVNELIS
jgi:DNA-binding response OmpR family regulator